MDDQLFCPTCNKKIKIPDALMHKFLDTAKASLSQENKQENILGRKQPGKP